MPALLIGASEDIRPSWPTEQLAALIPDARYVTIDGAAHAIWLTHANELGEVIRAFIDEIDDG